MSTEFGEVALGQVEHNETTVHLAIGARGNPTVSLTIDRRNPGLISGSRASAHLPVAEAKEVVALMLKAIELADRVSAQAAEFELQHAELTERQQAIMTKLIGGES